MLKLFTRPRRVAAPPSPETIEPVAAGIFTAGPQARLAAAFAAFHLRTAHGTLLASSAGSPAPMHAHDRAPGQELVLFRSLVMPQLGLLVATRDLDLYDGMHVGPLVALMLIEHPGTNTIALRSPIRDVHLCALAIEHLGEIGTTDFCRDWIGPWELFSPHSVPVVLPEPRVTEALLDIARLLEDRLTPEAIVAWLGGRRAPVALAVQALVHLMARGRIVPSAPRWIAQPERELEQEALRPPLPCTPIAGPLRLASEFRPGTITEHRPVLRGGWLAEPGGRLLATGARCMLVFHLHSCPTHARLRLELRESHHPILMTVCIDGWCVGRTALGLKKIHGSRLEYWIPREAIRSGTITITLDFTPAISEAQALPHAFELLSCSLHVGPDAQPDAQPDAKTAAIPQDPAVIMASFESLGEDCEFGFVQRWFGIEPISIFRFAGTSNLYSLIKLLETDFEGLGASGSLTAVEHQATIYRGGGEPDLTLAEFYMRDDARELYFHTWKGPADHTIAEATQENEQKLAYLARKFLEDLEDGEKIWLFKDTRRADLNEAYALHALLNRHGPNRLFWITRIIEGRPAGSVEWIAPGLLRGYSDQPHTDAQRFDAQGWLALCRNALRAFAEPA